MRASAVGGKVAGSPAPSEKRRGQTKKRKAESVLNAVTGGREFFSGAVEEELDRLLEGSDGYDSENAALQSERVLLETQTIPETPPKKGSLKKEARKEGGISDAMKEKLRALEESDSDESLL